MYIYPAFFFLSRSKTQQPTKANGFLFSKKTPALLAIARNAAQESNFETTTRHIVFIYSTFFKQSRKTTKQSVPGIYR